MRWRVSSPTGLSRDPLVAIARNLKPRRVIIGQLIASHIGPVADPGDGRIALTWTSFVN